MASRRTAVKVLTNKTCKQMTDLIFKYANDTLAPRLKRDFHRHLAICPDCIAFLNTYKKTITLTRAVRTEEMPAKVRDNLLEFLRSRARKRSKRLTKV